MDLIEVEGLRLRCVIGCRTEERRDRSDVVIDLVVRADARKAGASDDLADAWDYRAAVKAVIAEVEASECFTLEALATRVARVLVCAKGAPWARVRVSRRRRRAPSEPCSHFRCIGCSRRQAIP